MRKMKLSEMVLDFDFYPRASINTHHVSEMARAAANGATFPPIVIDKKSKRIADGFHRHRVFSRLLGVDGLVDVIEKSYRNEKELFLDAIRFNAHHGLKMDTHDTCHAIHLAEKLGIDDSLIAGALTVDPKYVGELRVDRSATSGGLFVPLKRTIRHMAGKKLTKQQSAANDRLSGMEQIFYCNQVITLIESDLLDTSNADLMERLAHLGELIAGISVPA